MQPLYFSFEWLFVLFLYAVLISCAAINITAIAAQVAEELENRTVVAQNVRPVFTSPSQGHYTDSDDTAYCIKM
jgi:hypothetical protein